MPVKQVKLTLNVKHAISLKTFQGLHLQANNNLSVDTGPGLSEKLYILAAQNVNYFACKCD